MRQADREWVSVADEIEFVRSYLQIEQVRFGERLCVRIEMEKSAAKVRIPAMTIQTLAENAVKHGITAARHSGLITVSEELIACEEHGSKVIVTVSDNGPGFQHGGLWRLMSDLEADMVLETSSNVSWLTMDKPPPFGFAAITRRRQPSFH